MAYQLACKNTANPNYTVGTKLTLKLQVSWLQWLIMKKRSVLHLGFCLSLADQV
jgi:hypothetical protein